jgi:flagellar basal-body rod modification protein FlgD
MSAIGSSTSSSNPVSATNAFNKLSSEDFVKIMISELSHQDPLAPNDSKAILEQISSIRAIESDLSLQDALGSLVQQSQFASAGGLIGKSVVGRLTDGAVVQGLVHSVSNSKEGPSVNLTGGWNVGMADILQIAEAPEPESGT